MYVVGSRSSVRVVNFTPFSSTTTDAAAHTAASSRLWMWKPSIQFFRAASNAHFFPPSSTGGLMVDSLQMPSRRSGFHMYVSWPSRRFPGGGNDSGGCATKGGAVDGAGDADDDDDGDGDDENDEDANGTDHSPAAMAPERSVVCTRACATAPGRINKNNRLAKFKSSFEPGRFGDVWAKWPRFAAFYRKLNTRLAFRPYSKA